jgi:hypothetical protein
MDRCGLLGNDFNEGLIMLYRLDGYCGLNCGACPALLGTQAGTEVRPCHGCKSDKIDPQRYCATCAIKVCARGRGFEFCIECPDLESCDLLQKFIADEKWPYHQGVMNNMKFIKREGLTKWLDVQEQRWRCALCGTAHSWWDETCPHCGAVVASYLADK